MMLNLIPIKHKFRTKSSGIKGEYRHMLFNTAIKYKDNFYPPNLDKLPDRIYLYARYSNSYHEPNTHRIINKEDYIRNQQTIDMYWSIGINGKKCRGYIKDDEFVITKQ